MPTPDEERVRRLLADARHDEPMPADVVARLDGVLADLAAERRAPAPVAPLRPADDRRRRRTVRRWTGALVAAAAVVVGGAVVGELRPQGSGSGAGSGAASDSGGFAGDAGEGRGSQPTPPPVGQPELEAAYRALGVKPLPAGTGARCDDSHAGLGRRQLVRDGGATRLLVLRPAADGNRAVDLLDCDTGALVRSVTLPVR